MGFILRFKGFLGVLGIVALTLGLVPGPARAADRVRHDFQRQALTDVYYSEGIGVGDLNRDGQLDLVYGPLWFAGPDFKAAREIYPPKPQNTERYADHFFAWIHDFNGDGWDDVLTAGFPGTPGYVYENPGKSETPGGHWRRHEVVKAVCNESPQFTNIVGDERPELVCSQDGYFGYAAFEPGRGLEPWTFHPVSEKVAPIPFGHGLGVGDVNGDRRLDILTQHGWFQQPETLNDDSRKWAFHAFAFAPIGGADMYAYDVDGDGDNDVITSLAAHDFGLAWYEQVRDGGAIGFKAHRIMGDLPEHNRYGLVFSEPHSVQLADIDGDGLKDIITGKTYYSHHKQSPMWDAGAVVYWFKLTRGPQGVDWVPYLADGESGIGRQLVVQDINKDGLPDLAAGGMKGAHVLLQRRVPVDEEAWKALQPRVFVAPERPAVSGPQAKIEPKTGRVAGAIEAEALNVIEATGGKAAPQKMAGFKTGTWSGGEQLLWSGGRPGDRLELQLDAPANGEFEVIAALTRARDFGIVQLALDGVPLGPVLDLYHYPEVLASGELSLGKRMLTAGKHRLTIEIKGANPSALKSHLFGVDYIRLEPR